MRFRGFFVARARRTCQSLDAQATGIRRSPFRLKLFEHLPLLLVAAVECTLLIKREGNFQ